MRPPCIIPTPICNQVSYQSLTIMFDFACFLLTFSDALEAKANTVADEVMDPLISSDEDDRVTCVPPHHPYLSYP